MKRLFSCWLFSVMLALGFSATASAGGHGHQQGGGGGPISNIKAPFWDVFTRPGDVGTPIERIFNFTVGSQSSFSAMILSSGIDEFVGTLIGRKGNFDAKQFSFDDGMHTFSTLIGPGKYSFVLLGTVAEVPAGYLGKISIAPVPEPAEWMMIIAGVAMMGFVVSRRRNIG